LTHFEYMLAGAGATFLVITLSLALSGVTRMSLE
jgi:hypothetical protein